MARFDVFNGDADGICALHQLQLVTPAESVPVTGSKRDIALLARIPPHEPMRRIRLRDPCRPLPDG
jgi:hypothetical protein